MTAEQRSWDTTPSMVRSLDGLMMNHNNAIDGNLKMHGIHSNINMVSRNVNIFDTNLPFASQSLVLNHITISILRKLHQSPASTLRYEHWVYSNLVLVILGFTSPKKAIQHNIV
eukprot:800162_1